MLLRVRALASLVALAAIVTGAPQRAVAQDMTPPHLVAPPAPVWPEGEPPREAEVTVMVEVAADGAVTDVTLVYGVSPRIDAAALEAARALRFDPARLGAGPVASRVRLLVRLEPPRAPVAPEPPAPPSPTVAPEPSVMPAQGSQVRERVGGEAGSQYETVVTARAVHEEISRQTLAREEITRMPGTMGDPFRVIDVLPGVVPLLTGVPYYYVRGAPPADNGTFLDGVRIPALFHLALGPSVIHPTLVDRIDFFTGGAPARYPSFVGGVIAASSAEIPRDRVHLDADMRIVDTGAMLSVPLNGGRTRLAASGRYSYTALLLSLLQEDVFVDYWDYQLRFEHDVTRRHSVSVMALGAFDELGQMEHIYAADGSETGRTDRVTAFAQAFHKLDVKSRHRLGGGRTLELAGGVGLEQSLFGDDGLSGQDVTFGPRATLSTPLGSDVDLRLGADVSATASSFIVEDDDVAEDPTPSRHLLGGGLFAEADIRAGDTTLMPGVRVATFHAEGTSLAAIDPRLGVRHDLGGGVTLKGSVGLYHQPPAFLVPIPGLGALDWDRGLQRSIQLSQGVEWQLPWGVSADAQIFYHRYENLSDIVFDDPYDPDEDDFEDDGSRSFEEQFPRLRGNAYGLELIVRRRLTERLFGWVAYTLSRSERVLPGVVTSDGCRGYQVEHTRGGLAPSDADRTHVLNAVASYELPGGFRAGARLHVRSGRPFTRQRCWNLGNDDWRPTYGPRGGERMPTYVRLDLRIDKRWRYRSWDLELYFEVMNVTFAKDVLEMTQWERDDGTVAEPTADDAVPIVIPTLGLRAVF